MTHTITAQIIVTLRFAFAPSGPLKLFTPRRDARLQMDGIDAWDQSMSVKFKRAERRVMFAKTKHIGVKKIIAGSLIFSFWANNRY